MKLKDDLGGTARVIYVIMGLALAAATIASAWHDWPAVMAGKSPPFSFWLMLIVALPLSLLVIIWACIGRHREWTIEGGQVRIRLLSLTSWQKTAYVPAAEITGVVLESFDHEVQNHRTAYWLTLTDRHGDLYRSPTTFSRTEAEKAAAEIEAMRDPAK